MTIIKYILNLFKRRNSKIDSSYIPKKYINSWKLHDTSTDAYYYDFNYFKIFVETEIIKTKHLEKQVYHITTKLDDGTEIKCNRLFDSSNLLDGLNDTLPEIKKHYAKKTHELNIRKDHIDYIIKKYNSDI